MEWVSYIAGEDHSDAPVCVDPVLRYFGIVINDSMPNDERQKLRPYLARMIGTANDGLSEWRMFRLADLACREWAPTVLEATGLIEQAAKLRALAPVVDKETAYAATAADAAAEAAYAAAFAYAATAAAATAAAAYARNAANTAAEAAAVNANWSHVYRALDELLPTEPVMLPADQAKRAVEVCEAVC